MTRESCDFGAGGTLEGWIVEGRRVMGAWHGTKAARMAGGWMTTETAQIDSSFPCASASMSAVSHATARHGISNGRCFFSQRNLPSPSLPHRRCISPPSGIPLATHDTLFALDGHLQWCPTNLAWHVEDTSMDSLNERNVRVQFNGEMRLFQTSFMYLHRGVPGRSSPSRAIGPWPNGAAPLRFGLPGIPGAWHQLI